MKTKNHHDAPQKEFSSGGDEERNTQENRPYRSKTEGDRPYRARPEGDRPYRPKTEGDRPYRARPEGDRPYRPKTEGDRPYRPRPEGDRPYRARPEGDRPYRPRTESDRPFRTRPEGDRPFRPRTDGDRPYRAKPEGDRPFRSRTEGDRPYRPRPEGDRPYRPRTEGDRPYRPRPEGDRPYRARTEGDKPYRPKPEGDKPYRPRTEGDKPYHRTPQPEGVYADTDQNRKLRPRKNKQLEEVPPKIRERVTPEFIKDEMRLNKYISNSGVCSRREADEFIAAGLVTVNGEVVTAMGTRVKSSDDIRFNGERLKGEEKVYILMNKPKDFVTSTDDPHAEQTVMDLLAGHCEQRVYPVGRLDKSTTGVLLLTNDGALTEQLTHPSHDRKKIYQVDLDKNLQRTDMELLVQGIELEDGMAHVDEISYIDENEKKIGVEIHSGRNRIIRRMFEQLGYSVKKLDRVYFAGLTKKGVRRGAWRFLTPREVGMLKMGSYE